MRHSIRLQIFAGFSLLILVFTACVAGVILRITSAELAKRAQAEAQAQSDQVVREIDDYMDTLRNTYISCVTDRKVFTEIDASNGLQSSYSYSLNIVRTFSYNSQYIYSIYLYDIANERLLNSQYTSPGSLLNHKWLNSSDLNTAGFHLLCDSDYPSADKDDDKINFLVYAGPLRYEYFGSVIGYVSVNASLVEMKQRLYPDTESLTRQYVLDSDGNLVFGDSISDSLRSYIAGITEDGASSADLGGVSCLVVRSTSAAYGWKVIRVIPSDEVYGSVNSMAKLLITITAAFILLSIILSYVLARGFTRPVYELKDMMSSYRNGSSKPVKLSRAMLRRSDDFRELFESYGEMVQRTDHLIDEVYRANLNKKEMEIKMLQASINPHFIYNVMDSINWILKMGEYEKAGVVLTVFSRYLRNTLSFHRDYVTVSELQEQMDTYCRLQQFFSDDKITYEIAFDSDILACKVTTLLLQPIVENAYTHGFRSRKGGGSIRISGSASGDAACFVVEDNGVGIPEEKLNELRRAIRNDDEWEDENYFGLHSVAKRIRLAYGAEYGIEIESSPDKGTKVKIKTKILV